MSQGLKGILELLFAPPGGIILLIVAGLWLMRRRPRLGFGLIGAGAALLFLASLPIIAGALLSMLEPYPPLSPAQVAQPEAEAIVVLGGGRRNEAEEYGGDTLKAISLERLRYGAWLAKRTGLPLLVSGGLGEDGHPAEAEIMQQVLEQEYSLSPRWVEPDSRTTYENAEFSAKLLKAAGIERVYLVTHACHLPRAVWSFNQFQLDTIPAPTAFNGLGKGPREVRDFLPNARALEQTAFAVHEMMGYVWYRVRY